MQICVANSKDQLDSSILLRSARKLLVKFRVQVLQAQIKMTVNKLFKSFSNLAQQFTLQ